MIIKNAPTLLKKIPFTVTATGFARILEETIQKKLSSSYFSKKHVIAALNASRTENEIKKLNRNETQKETTLYDEKDLENFIIIQFLTMFLNTSLKKYHKSIEANNFENYLLERLNNSSDIELSVQISMKSYIIELKQLYSNQWHTKINWELLYKDLFHFSQQNIISEFEELIKTTAFMFLENEYSIMESNAEEQYLNNDDYPSEDFDIPELISDDILDQFENSIESEIRSSFMEVKADYNLLNSFQFSDLFYNEFFNSLLNEVKKRDVHYWFNMIDEWKINDCKVSTNQNSNLDIPISEETILLSYYLYTCNPKYIKTNQMNYFLIFRNALFEINSLNDHFTEYLKYNKSKLLKAVERMEKHKQTFNINNENIWWNLDSLAKQYSLNYADYFNNLQTYQFLLNYEKYFTTLIDSE